MSAVPAFQPEHIPAFLQALPQWLCWVLRDVPGKKKLQKIPVRVENGALIDAGAATPSTWVTFEQACASVAFTQASGVGLCPMGITSGEWRLILLDLDDVEPQGLLSYFQQADLYAEISPSGNGVRSAFWLHQSHPAAQLTKAWAKISWTLGHAAGQLNINGGYCTFTGNVLHPGKEQFLTELPFGLTLTPTSVDDVGELEGINWQLPPLEPHGLRGAAWSVFHGEGGHDRSNIMLHVLATLSWQCNTPEELAGRAWNTEHLHQYFVDHRSQRGLEHQQAFCAQECSKAWSMRNTHAPIEKQFDLVQQQVHETGYEYELQFLDNVTLRPPSWMVENVLVTGATMFVGDPEAGKTWVLISLAIAVATGYPWLGLNDVHETGLVVYLASEDKGGVMQRMRSLLKGQPGAHILLHVIEGRLDEERVLRLQAEIQAYCNTLGIKLKLVIVDTYVGYSTAKENQADEVQEFLQRVKFHLCTPFGAALAVAHHLGKDGETRGSSNLEAYFDLVWTITKGGDFTEMRPKKVKQFDKKLIPGHALQVTTDDRGYLEMVKTAGVAPAQDDPADAEVTTEVAVDNDTPHWQRVATEQLIVSLVKDGITSASRIAKGAEYKLMRDQTIAVAKGNMKRHPFQAAHTGDVVERLIRAQILVARVTGRGVELSLAEGFEWTPAVEWQRLCASYSYMP